MILIFVNPFSGSGKNRQRVDALAQVLHEKYNLESRIIDTLEERRAQLADSSLCDRCTTLVVAGGDGTVAAVINEMSDSARAHIPVALMSVGNENLLARELGLLHVTPEKLAAAIANDRIRRIDVGQATAATTDATITTTPEPRIFTLMASAGLDSDVVCRVEAWRKLPKGLRRVTRLSYLKPMLAAVFCYAYQPLRVIADGQTIIGTHAFIFNINRYGGGLRFAPSASATDGLLDYLILKKPGRFHAIRYLTLVALGWHTNRKDIQTGVARHIKIESEKPLAVQADGDTIGHTTMDFKVIPDAVKLILPAS